VAIPDIINLLTFAQTVSRETQIGNVGVACGLFGPDKRYPAIRALRSIGKPSLPSLAKVIETHDSSSTESRNAHYAIILIFVGKLRDGVAYVKTAASRSRTQLGSQRLMVVGTKFKRSSRIEQNKNHG